MRMDRTARAWPAGVAALALLAAGCDDGTSPSDAFDPEATAAVVDDVLNSANYLNDPFFSLSAFASSTSPSFVAPELALRPPQLVGAMVRWPAERSTLRWGPAPEVVIPSEVRGKTYVYDAALDHYVEASTSDAPANGIRVHYYLIDPFTFEIVEPLEELGYIELTDHSGTSDVLHVVVVETRASPDLVVADYWIDYAFVQTTSSLAEDIDILGFMQSRTRRVDFDLLLSGTDNDDGTGSIDYVLEVGVAGGASLHLSGGYTATQADPDPDELLTFTITSGSQTVVLDLSWAVDGVVAGALLVNGTTVIDISGTGDAPVFASADGDALSLTERQALTRVFHGIGQMFFVVIFLLFPAGIFG